MLLDGHDTNLAALASLLGLHWTLYGRTDDTPPGAQLSFELHEDGRTHARSIRIVFRAQTLEQLRTASPFVDKALPESQMLVQPDCAEQKECPLALFLTGGRSSLDDAYVQRSFEEPR